jgi:uncharacterized protein YybS (DUF2232 family)
MYQRSAGGRWLEILLFTTSSLILYHTGVGLILFLVPLQVVCSRRGLRGLALSAAVFMVVFLGIRFVPLLFGSRATQPDILVYAEIGIVLLLLLGLIGMNLPVQRLPRKLYLLLGAAAVAGVVAVPLGLLFASTQGFRESIANLFVEVSKTLSGVFAPADGAGGSLLSSLLEPAKLQQISEAYFLRSFLVDYVVLLAFSWWAGQAAAARTAIFFGARPGFRFAGFRLESWWLWPLIISGALVLADLFFGISALAYVAWNIGLVLLFLFGLQGLAIIRFVFEKHGVPRFLWLLLIVGLAMLAASPRAGLFVILAVPAFGVSENWIRYRIPRDTAPTEEE